MSEQTFALIKPTAVFEGHAGPILTALRQAGFQIKRQSVRRLTQAQAQALYAEHSARPFYQELCDYITSGPVLLMELEKEGAVAALRELMGATNPAEAASGTLRARFGVSIGDNAIHGSDSAQSAQRELGIFFGSRF